MKLQDGLKVSSRLGQFLIVCTEQGCVVVIEFEKCQVRILAETARALTEICNIVLSTSRQKTARPSLGLAASLPIHNSTAILPTDAKKTETLTASLHKLHKLRFWNGFVKYQ